MSDVLVAHARVFTRNRGITRDGLEVGSITFPMFSRRCTVVLDDVQVECRPVFFAVEVRDHSGLIARVNLGLCGFGAAMVTTSHGEFSLRNACCTVHMRVKQGERTVALVHRKGFLSSNVRGTFADPFPTAFRAALLGIACIRVEQQKSSSSGGGG